MAGGGVGTTSSSWRPGPPIRHLRPEKDKEPALGRAEGTAAVYLIGALGYKEQKTQLHKTHEKLLSHGKGPGGGGEGAGSGVN